MASREKSGCIGLAFEGERLCRNGDHAAGVQCFEEAVNLGTDDCNVLSAIYCQLGNAYISLGDFVKAVQYHRHDRTLARTINDLAGEAKASGNLSSTLKMMERYDEAIVCCQRHLDISRELSIKSEEARALYNMANIYHLKGKQNCKRTDSLGKQDPNAVSDLTIAVKFYNANLVVVKQLGDRAAEGKVSGSLGNTHYLLGNCTEAVNYHTERLAIAKEFGDKAAQRRAYTNLGNTHVLLHNFQLAIELYLQTLSISRQLGDPAFEAQACYSLGSTYTLLGDFKNAIEYHMRHKQIAEELNDRVGVARACWLLSNSHTSLGNYHKAMDFTKQQLQISTEIGDEAGKATAEKLLSDLISRVGESTQDVPRVRRASMENMQLLSFTPEQDKNTRKTSVGSDKGRNIFPTKIQVGLTNGNRAAHVNDLQPTRNGRDRKLDVADSNAIHNHNVPANGIPDNDKFFDFLTRLQGRRMDDQRAEMRGDEELDLPEFLRQEQENGRRPEEAANEQEQEEHHEKMSNMINMLARSQSKRLNEQRVSLSSLPGFRITQASLNSLPSVPPDEVVVDREEPDRNNNDAHGAENAHRSLNDNFFDNLIRCQGTRLNDQRSAAPSSNSFPTPTIPDEDFFSLILRMQSSRFEDQRCGFQPDNA
ncbi:G-protein-signaling modulator 2-like isoform X1 [Clavelina lepadiformis]|uniref:G-protein-signaling modulator 2-like isoform X1 n=1 Tax=Clavelina lepadiformis TaxID=159417 RepID=UPI0040434A41